MIGVIWHIFWGLASLAFAIFLIRLDAAWWVIAGFIALFCLAVAIAIYKLDDETYFISKLRKKLAKKDPHHPLDNHQFAPYTWGDSRLDYLQIDKEYIKKRSKQLKDRGLDRDKEIESIMEFTNSHIDITMETGKKWITSPDGEPIVIVPDSYDMLRAFVADWRPLCSESNKKRVDRFEKALKRKYGINDDMRAHLMTRFIAGIIRDQTKKAYETLIVLLEAGNIPLKRGSTYLYQVNFMMRKILEHTKAIENNSATVSAYDYLRSRY